jgi:phage terminase large subunit
MISVDLSNLIHIVNRIYWPAFKFKGRFLVLYGGAGSGKSWAMAQKIIKRILTESDHNILCVRKTGNTIHKSQFALLVGTIKAWGLEKLFKINEAEGKEKIVCLLNGNMIQFAGLDDTEKLKSIYNITSVWVEEASEIEEEDFKELNRRLRGYKGYNKDGTEKYMQIMITFNPVSMLHWLKSFFVDRDYPKILLWDTAEAEALKTDLNEFKGMVIHSTYKDNKFIDDAYAEEMESEEDEYHYNVYTLGLWGIVGHTYFNAEKVNNRIVQVQKQKPLKRGYFEYKTYFDAEENEVLINNKSIKWVDDPKGYVFLYELPKEGYPYCLGGDSAGEGSDWNTGQLVNNITGIQCATLRIDKDEDLYANQMYCLGMFYNEALTAIETNFSTHPMKVLTKLKYPNQYVREQRPDSYTGKLANIFGFNTNKATRPDALGIIRKLVREQPHLINDLETLFEMSTFIINEKGKPEAAEGKHDDMVMAYAIVNYIRPQQRKTVEYKPKEKKETLSAIFGTEIDNENGGYSWN